MTSQLGGNSVRLVRVFAAALLISALSACGTATKSATIDLATPADGAVLTLADDTDVTTSGMQLDVEGSSSGVPVGSVVLLKIEGDTSTVSSTVGSDGSIVFKDATLPAGTHKIFVSTAADSVHSDEDHSYTFRSLEIVAPSNNAALTVSDDLDPRTEAIDLNVTVAAFGLDGAAEVALDIDGKRFADMANVAANQALFKGVVLGGGTHTLQASTGTGADKLVSAEISVTVESTVRCPVAEFITPAEPATGSKIVLGGSSCPKSGKFTTEVAVSTNAAEGSSVTLTVNGVKVSPSVKVKGATARFSEVVLDRRSSSNTLSVSVEGEGGAVCHDVAFPVDIFVDCAGADCTIASPTPFSGFDANGDSAQYLNASMRGAKGFDVQVDTDASALGQPVQLIVDGNDRNAKSVDPATKKNKVLASFSALALADGKHTVQALCVDAAGNKTYSAEQTWNVDTVPCTAAISSPSADDLVIPTDDSDAATGVQVAVTTLLLGGDCSSTRAAVCTPATGITGVAFADHDGSSPLTSQVTVSTAGTQALCVEVKDRAGNKDTDSVEIIYRDTAPNVAIESPLDATSYNVSGDGSHTADADPLTTDTCEATFTVLCGDVGTAVDLHHGAVANPVFATANCVAAGGLPTGFSGRATFTKIAFLPAGSETTTVIATQSVTSASAMDFVGSSSLITLTGDCSAPVASFAVNPCQSSFAVPDGTTHATTNVTALEATDDVTNATLTVMNPTGGAIDSTAMHALVSGTAPFTGVDLGTSNGATASSATITLVVTDDFGNTDTHSCLVGIAQDVPTLTVTKPLAADPVYGPGTGCNSGMAGVFGVTLTAVVDQMTNRMATASVGTFSKPLTITGTAITDCLPAAEGSNTLTVTSTSSVSGGQTTAVVGFTVDTLNVTSPAAGGGVGASATCSTGMGSETGATVTGVVDSIHNGRTVTLQAGANRSVSTTASAGAFTACVPVSAAPNSAVSNSVVVNVLQGATVVATETRTFKVVTTVPSHAIAIMTVTPPLTSSATYRTDPVALQWTAPVENFVGQFVDYELGCSNSALDVTTMTTVQQDAWWAGAELVKLPSTMKPPTVTGNVIFRIGDNRNCALRAADVAGQLTPLASSKVVSYPFRSHVFQPTSTGQKMGQDVAPVGDVNGDGFNDLLVGGVGEAYLIFGSATGWGATTPDVVFVGTVASRFGGVVAGIGDFNGDKMNDFAISASTTTSGALTNVGRVFVFYGRPPDSPWPMTVNITGTCAADVCFDHEFGTAIFGTAVSSAGDFNDDGFADLAVGASAYPGASDPIPLRGRLYILLGQAFEGSSVKPMSQDFWQIDIAVPSGARGLYVEGDNVSVNSIGASVAPLGKFDSSSGDDLVVAAPSSVSSAAVSTGKAFFLSGHPYDFATDTGMKKLALTELGFRDMGGTPSGAPIDTGTKGFFAGAVYSIGNVIDSSSATKGMQEIAIRQASTNEFLMYLGDDDFNPSSKIHIQGDQTGKNPSTGSSVASGFSPALQSIVLGDLDDDGFADVCAGENLNSMTGTVPGAAYLWYSPVVSTKTTSGILSYAEAASIAPAAPAGATSRVAEFVGDLDADGAPDIAIGDATATSTTGAPPVTNASVGALTILY